MSNQESRRPTYSYNELYGCYRDSRGRYLSYDQCTGEHPPKMAPEYKTHNDTVESALRRTNVITGVVAPPVVKQLDATVDTMKKTTRILAKSAFAGRRQVVPKIIQKGTYNRPLYINQNGTKVYLTDRMKRQWNEGKLAGCISGCTPTELLRGTPSALSSNLNSNVSPTTIPTISPTISPTGLVSQVPNLQLTGLEVKRGD